MKATNYHNQEVEFAPGQAVCHVTDDGLIVKASIKSVEDGLLVLTFEDGDEGAELPATCYHAAQSLRDLLISRSGYHTLTATLGTNGNGGMLSLVDDIISADEDNHLDLYTPATIKDGELEKHMHDAGGKIEDGDEWVAFDCHHLDPNGYLTGSVSRIYVNMAV